MPINDPRFDRKRPLPAASARTGASARRKASAPSLIPSERKIDILGVGLVAFALFTLLAFLSPGSESLPGAWALLLRRLFGIGAFGVPVAIALPGAYLILRRFRSSLPVPGAVRAVGIALLVFNLLAFAHFFLNPANRDEVFAFAWKGWGGGVVGGFLLHLLLQTLDYPGTALVLVAWLVVAVILAFQISLPQAMAWLSERLAPAGRALRRLFAALADRVRERWPGRPDDATPSYDLEEDAEDDGEESEPESAPAPASPALPLATPVSAQAGRLSVEEAAAREVQPVISLGNPEPPPPWQLPDVAQILNPGVQAVANEEMDRQRARILEDTLQSFDAPVRVVEIHRGPTVTQFGVEPGFTERGGKSTRVKVNKITARADDLTLALAAPSIRIQAPVPGKGYVGIEVPNAEISLVALRDVVESDAFRKKSSPLRVALGKDVSGAPSVADLAAMPHLLIAGTTGSGKSVCVNAIITCFLLHNTPDELRLLMVDPKRVELTSYNGIPHLLAPVVVDLDRVVGALQWVTREMEERYRKFSQSGTRNLEEYNKLLVKRGERKMPVWVVFIDELADLMLMAPDETERILTRIAQMARATGIHMVLATQRPSVDVLTGLIKANFPARIAFAVASQIDSRVILDQPGADRLLGRGDMLFQSPDSPAPVRLQGAYVSEAELLRLVQFWRSAYAARKEHMPAAPIPDSPSAPAIEHLPEGPLEQVPMFEKAEEDDGEDKILEDAIRAVRQWRKASTTRLQRHFGIGYTRAARLMDALEDRGIIGPPTTGSQPREVIDFGEGEMEEDDDAED